MNYINNCDCPQCPCNVQITEGLPDGAFDCFDCLIGNHMDETGVRPSDSKPSTAPETGPVDSNYPEVQSSP